MKTHDVSVVLRPTLPVWPGEPALEIRRVRSIASGDPANVSAFGSGCHIGTHIDAPLHFIEGGKSVEQLPLDLFLGRVRVCAMEVRSCIGREDIEQLGLRSGERVIFKTSNSNLWEMGTFQRDFVYITEQGARCLVDTGAKTVGIDYLSVERFGLEGSPTHHILLGAGIGVIEGLDLRVVEPGDYELVCLPLRLAGADGSPARVILREVN
jgi:arylformamidase